MYVPTETGPSPLAQELGEQLARTVRDFRLARPEASAADVDRAVRIARRILRLESGIRGRSPAWPAALIGLAVAVALAGLLFTRGGLAGSPYFVLVVIVAIAVAVVAVKATRR